MGVENEELNSPDSSAEVNMDAQTPDTADADAGAGPSAAPEGEKFDLLSVVRNAAQPAEENSASPAPEESDKPQADASAEKTDPKEPDEENFSDVPFHAHPRFKQLVQQRNHYREGARQYDQVQNFLTSNGITPDEAADILSIRALMKRDPSAAWKELKPIVQKLLVDAGEVIPQDLQQRVRAGQMTREAAIEMSRLRAAHDTSARRVEFEREEAQRHHQAEKVRSVQTAVADWERAIRGRDPDFDAKAEALQKEVLWLQQKDGRPDSPDGARKMLETALANVNKTVRAAPKPEKRPVTGGRVASGQPTAAPKSTLDIIRSVRSQG